MQAPSEKDLDAILTVLCGRESGCFLNFPGNGKSKSRETYYFTFRLQPCIPTTSLRSFINTTTSRTYQKLPLSYKCMNQLLFDRSSGILSPQAFARIQLSALVRALQPAPRLRFNGGEREVPQQDDIGNGVGSQAAPSTETRIWAHQAGANALALDIESRMCALRRPSCFRADTSSLISGGADSSIKLWDLDELSAGWDHTLTPTGVVPR